MFRTKYIPLVRCQRIEIYHTSRSGSPPATWVGFALIDPAGTQVHRAAEAAPRPAEAPIALILPIDAQHISPAVVICRNPSVIQICLMLAGLWMSATTRRSLGSIRPFPPVYPPKSMAFSAATAAIFARVTHRSTTGARTMVGRSVAPAMYTPIAFSRETRGT